MVHGSTILSWMIASAVVLVSNKLVRDFMSLLFLMSSLMDTGMPSLYPDIFFKRLQLDSETIGDLLWRRGQKTICWTDSDGWKTEAER